MATTSMTRSAMLPVPGGRPAVGADSTGQLAHEGGLGLARALGVEAVVFPGDHGGFDGRPAEFAARLLDVLEGGRR